MAITKEKKVAILDKLNTVLATANNVAFVAFRGVPVSEITRIRGELYGHGVGYMVAKKTLIKRALEAKGFAGDMPELPGEIAVAYSDDELAAAREVHGYGKQLKDSFTLVGGIFEQRYQNQEEMTAIATIPPLDTLRGMFVNVINSPIQRTAIVLSEIAKARG